VNVTDRHLTVETLRALISPRRLVPILVVAVPMVVAQATFSQEPWAASALAIGMCIAFVLVAPLSWRWLFPLTPSPDRAPLVRAAAYLVISAGTVLVIGGLLPRALGMGFTFLTDPWSLSIACALFIAGGWGLGRDVELEDRLELERRRGRDLQLEAERAQLLALRSHLDPHFLFNTLNAIAEWCREDGEVAERATLELSAMLRSVLDGVRTSSWPLTRELSLLDTLFALHLFRDENLFELVTDVPDPPPDVEVPPMLLLPLAENAIKHGPASGHRGQIRVEVTLDGEAVHVLLSNPGVFQGDRPGGEGLRIAKSRLALAYGGRAKLEVRTAQGRTTAEIIIPRDARVPEVRT